MSALTVPVSVPPDPKLGGDGGKSAALNHAGNDLNVTHSTCTRHVGNNVNTMPRCDENRGELQAKVVKANFDELTFI